jgi:hypothetical protein
VFLSSFAEFLFYDSAMIRLSQLPWGLAVALLAALPVSAGPSINVALKAAFSSAPYLLELLYVPDFSSG